MRRLLLLALATLLVLGAAPAALAQVPEDDDPPDLVPTPDPTPIRENDGDPESAPTPDSVCEQGGTDADYAYCGDPCPTPDADYQSDADYAYCPQPSAGGDDEGGPRSPPRTLAAGKLPVTGSEPSMLAILGLGMLLAGAGLRLRFARP